MCERQGGFFSFNYNNTCFTANSTIDSITCSLNPTTFNQSNFNATNATIDFSEFTSAYDYLKALKSTNQTQVLESFLGHMKAVTPSDDYFQYVA